MLLQPLSDLRTEVNRLMIAGSRFAHHDPRLQKLLPIFEKMGEKAPIFKKIAEHIHTLVNAETQDSAAHLTALSTLLYAVLYTQGKSEINGEQTSPQPILDIETLKTPLTYLELAPTITALNTTGSGRYEIITDAYARGLIHDVRLYSHIARGIEDKYADIADEVVETIIPAIGAPMIPFLLADLTLVDNKGNARRIELLDQLGHTFTDEWIDNILNGKATKLQVALMPALSRNLHHLDHLLAAAKSQKKALKEAAYLGLARSPLPEAWDFLMAAFNTQKLSTLELMANTLQSITDLRGDDATFLAPLLTQIEALSTFEWSEDYGKTADIFRHINAYVRIFDHIYYPELIEHLISFSQQLNDYEGQRSQKQGDANFKPFSEEFDRLQSSIARYFGELRLPEDHPDFERTLNAVLIQDHYARRLFIENMRHLSFCPHFIYRAFKQLYPMDQVINFANILCYLIDSVDNSPYTDGIAPRFYVLYQYALTAPNPQYADPRWADDLYDFCSTQEFLMMLRSNYTKRGQNAHNAFDVLALLHGLEPKDSPRMIECLTHMMHYLSYDKMGTIFAYLEERMGSAKAAPRIIEKINAEFARLGKKPQGSVEYLANLTQRAAAQNNGVTHG